MSFAKAYSGLKGAAVRALAIGACGLAVAGCDTLSSLNPFDKSETYKPEIVADVPAEQLYNDGLARIQKRDFEGAAKKFSALDKQYPYSEWARKGLIMAAYANYEGGLYEESITAAKRYLQLHPSSPDAAYAQYLLASSYYDQIPDITRDQEKSERALMALQELIQRYPKSEYVADAKKKIQVASDQLAGKEMEVGRFYLQKRNYSGAINRFRTVVSRYQTTRHVEEALERLTEAYMAMGIVNEAQTAAAVLGHNFPDSPWYKDAYALLTKGGVEPRENSESWISKAFRGVPQVSQRAG
ncbi:outer membrane protein assembly factor BamD [Microvirga thermotolerans]|uniref:Outer membrane protein assembly factor BamD n=1 Tax=Microvirga thermotolerans TaxID=2651334 RepID=A0A5P9JYC0_9HYPH|nr:outer membrane protein assembly factor BamD [Microvirga thermotolerans]QFU17121.1 outer membrane protein assembly factor BamD [Microvirga thermotolerans]